MSEVLCDESASCILLMDLDRFKEISDTLGHRYGDLLLVELPNVLSTGDLFIFAGTLVLLHRTCRAPASSPMVSVTEKPELSAG